MLLQAVGLCAALLTATPETVGTEPTDSIPGWKDAAGLAAGCREMWDSVFKSLDADSSECEAVIFPELLRYNKIRDGVEQTVLLVPYVQKGREGADYSVGMFQMKPSFAEQLEEAWMESPLSRKYALFFDLSDRKEVRRRRVERLADDEWQCVYLAMFVRLMLEREPSLGRMVPAERVSLLATAYNYSFKASLESLAVKSREKSFHLDFIRSKKTICYSYASLAARRLDELERITE